MINWFLNRFRAHRDLQAALDLARRSDRLSHSRMMFYADLAYDRRTALLNILKCQTPKSNGTVQRMAKIAADELAENQLRDAIATWAGFWKFGHNETDREILKRFYLTFDIDVLTAQGLNASEAGALQQRVLDTLSVVSNS